MKRSAIDRFVRSGKHRIALLSALAVVLNAVIIPFGQLLPGRVITAAAAGPTINEYLNRVTDVNGGTWQFTYDASHRMLTMTDPRGTVTQNVYDTSGRVTSQTLDPTGLNRATTFAYSGDNASATGGSTMITDPKGNVVVEQYKYAERQSVTRGSGTPQAATWTYAYDPNTVGITSITDPNSHVTSMTYDGSGNVLSVTDSLNRQTVNTYDNLNDLTTTTDPNNVKTTLTYDANANLLSRSTPLTGTAQTQATTYNYADTAHPGDVTSMVDPDGKTWTYAYDTYGNRASVADPLGDKTTYAYNGDSWMTSSVSPKGNVAGCGCQSSYATTYAYDSFGNVTTVTDPLGHQTVRHYDADQNQDSLIDGDTNKTTFVYDRANEQTQIQRPDSTTLTTDYNADGTVLDQKDGKTSSATAMTPWRASPRRPTP